MSARLYKFTGDKLVFSEGLARIKNRNGFGFINKSGEIVIKPRFQRTTDIETGFQSGLCAVTYRRKWGFINSEGEFVIPPIYRAVNSFREGAAAVQISDYRMSFIDTTGKRLFDSKYILLDEGFWMSSDRMNDFSEGLAYVIPEGDEDFRGGFINKSGEIVIKPQFTNEHAYFQDGVALVRIKNDWFVINRAGERFKSNWRIDILVNLYKGISFFRSGTKARLIDVTGEFVSDAKFDSQLSCFSEGLALVFVDGQRKFIDTTGTVILENPHISYQSKFQCGLALASMGKKYGFINHQGEFVIEPIFDKAFDFSDNVAQVKLGDKWGLIETSGNKIAGF